MLNLNVYTYSGNHGYWNKALEIPDPVVTLPECSEKTPQIVSAPEAIIYMIPEPNTRNKRMFFLSPKPHKFPSPTKAAFCIIYVGLSWKS